MKVKRPILLNCWFIRFEKDLERERDRNENSHSNYCSLMICTMFEVECSFNLFFSFKVNVKKTESVEYAWKNICQLPTIEIDEYLLCLRSHITSPERHTSKSSGVFFHLGTDCITIGLILFSQKIRIIIKIALPDSMDCLTFLILKMDIFMKKKTHHFQLRSHVIQSIIVAFTWRKKECFTVFDSSKNVLCAESDHLVSLGISSTHLNRRTKIWKTLCGYWTRRQTINNTAHWNLVRI